MSLAELEKQVRDLPPEERFRFLSWVYAHEHELIDPSAGGIAPDLMEELLRRRNELETGGVRTFSIEESTNRVREAVDGIRRSNH